MGMSASQVRFLSLQSRKNDIGNQLMSLSNKKLSLSRDMNAVSKNYTNAMNTKMLKWSNDSGATYNNLSYDLMMKPNDFNTTVPYIVSTNDGKVIVDSAENLIGRTWDATTGFSDYKELTNSGLSYEYFANKITTSATIAGNTGTVKTVDGVTMGSANPGVYVIPSGAMEFGFENTLRYEIFEELGLVSADTTNQYNELLTQMYGAEDGYEFGNYADLLQVFIGAGVTPASLDGQPDYAATLNAQFGRNAGISTNYGNYGTYFGHIDPATGTWAVDPTTGKTVGSLMGNLALAELAITEYDNWCKELKQFNLTEPTTHVFEATSGAYNEQTVQAFLAMNANTNDNITEDDATNNVKGTGLNSYTRGSLDNLTWENIYDNATSIVLNDNGGKAEVTKAFLDALNNSLSNANRVSNNNLGNTWTFTMPSNDPSDSDLVDIGGGSKVPVTEAAQLFAYIKTIEYYGNLEYIAAQNDDGCGEWACHSHNHFRGCASSYAVGEQANGLGFSEMSDCWFHSGWNFIVGALGTVLSAVQWLNPQTWLSACFPDHTWLGSQHVMINDTISSCWDRFTDSWQDDGGYTALDMRNVEKTYFTYYEMYMQAYINQGLNLFNKDDAGNVTSTAYDLATDNTEYKNLLNDKIQTVTTNADGSINVISKMTDLSWTHNTATDTYVYNGTDSRFTGMQYSITTKTAEFNGEEKTVTYYDGLVQTFDGGYCIINETADSSTRTYFLDTPVTVQSVAAIDANGNKTMGTVTYNRIKVKNGNVEYYNNNTKVDINKVISQNTDEYVIPTTGQKLKIKAGDTHQTSTVSAYITKDLDFIAKLEKQRQDALDAINELNDNMENFFGSKETKMMDYYDAIFQRIAEQGWVKDDKVKNNQYLNNKLMNNDFFVTVCVEKGDTAGYNFTNQLATNVRKIFAVNDTDEQNKALTKYEAQKSFISTKERRIDAQMQKLETEQEAINTEMESVKKIVDENISKTFKMFA